MFKYIVGILLFAFLFLGCWVYFVFSPEPIGKAPEPTFSGTKVNPAGGISFGYDGMGYHYGEKAHGVIVGWPGKIKDFDRPVWMVIIKFPDKKLDNKYDDKSHSSGEEWGIFYEGTIKGLPNGKEWKASYAVSNKNPLEVFKANDTTYPPEKGRIFLVDLTGNEPAVQQINEDPQKVFVKPKNQADPRPEIRQSLEKLKSQFPLVKEFIGDF